MQRRNSICGWGGHRGSYFQSNQCDRMSTKTAYWISVTTEECYNRVDYPGIAESLVEALRGVFADTDELIAITDSSVTHAQTECTVSPLEPIEVAPTVALVVVELEAEKHVPLDKSKLSSKIRARLPFKVKVQKRQSDQ